LKKLENDEHLAREPTAKQDILKKVDGYQNRASLAAEHRVLN
jgi:hypothetical protein